MNEELKSSNEVLEASKRDITELKRAEQVSLDAERSKNEFLAVLGHELRNPIAPIRNAAHVLSQYEALPDQVRWAVDLIERQSEQLEHLVNDLLDFARISGLRVQLRRIPVVVQDALEDALLSVAFLMEKCEQELETRLPEEPVVVMADPVRLVQVFTNLLRNAVKYTPDGGHIQLSLMQHGQDVVVRVQDDGIGIRPEYLPHLFDFFSRGETEHPNIQDADGLGVGLALSKQLMERHGGTLEGQSRGPGLGSVFIATLPVYSKSELAGSVVEAGVDTGTPTKARARRLLVVDDNPDVADSFRVLLEAMGHRVRTLNGGSEVIAVMRLFRPDVVFLDISMPDMDGFQVAALIRAEKAGPRPLLVALTGYAQGGDRKAALAASFDRYLLKPLNPEQIETLLEGLEPRQSG